MDGPLGLSLVAVDAGQTSTRAVVIGRDGGSSFGVAAGVRTIAAQNGPTEVAGLVGEAFSRAVSGNSGSVGTLCVGLSGLVADDELLETLAEAIFASVPAKRLVIASDAVTSYLGALGESAGIVAAVGTGLVVLGATGTGEWTRVGGWGYLLDDAGGGFDIGRQGLEVVVRCIDGRAMCGPLQDAAIARFGGIEMMRRAVYGAQSPAAVIAEFARDVLDAAEAGDDDARRIVDTASNDIADAVTAVSRRLFPGEETPRVALTGNIVTVGGVLSSRVGDILDATRRFVVSPPQGTALEAAMALNSEGSSSMFPGLVLDFEKA